MTAAELRTTVRTMRRGGATLGDWLRLLGDLADDIQYRRCHQ